MNTTERIKWGVVMQVKDEADVIETSVARWYLLGATVLVFDDGSTDGTLEILRQMAALDERRISVFVNPAEPYDMPKHINMMKNVLIHDDGINWIIPADADETWDFPHSPADFFERLPQVPSWGEVPYFDIFPNGQRRLHTHRKCFGYFTPEMEISIGNHLVIDGDKYPKIDTRGISIEHRPVRSYEQMKRKLMNHWEAYKDTYPDHPHAQNYRRWQTEGEAVFQEIWQQYNP